MTLLSINNLSYQVGPKVLFNDATFSIEASDKIAIIGPNGCGKTSLLNLIKESITAKRDEIAVQNGLRIKALAQTPDLDPAHTIQEHLNLSQTEASIAIQHYNKSLDNYNKDQSDDNEADYARAQERMDHLNLWDYEERVSSLLRELEITNLDQKINDLSGGMQKKITLAQSLFEETDLLILDEPTNHLDIKTIEWLELMLKKHQSAIIMVTHDRYFLDKICNKIIEIDQEKVYVYQGNYQSYLEQRDQRYQALEKQESRIQSILRVELNWLKRGPKARSTKQKARKDRIHDMLNRKTVSEQEQLSLHVEERRLGKKILKLKDISKSYGDKDLIKNFSYTMTKGEIIGILGPNGVGKSTLLNLITQKIKPDSGEVDVGVNTVFGYFDQHSETFDPDDSIIEHVKNIGSQFTTADGNSISASKLLEQFLFPSKMLKTKIGDLSGGERRRLYLVCLLLKNPNVLLFDEPTNDLDIQTLSVLEDFLLSFSGSVIIISHDRYFMDRVVNQLLVFDNHGHIKSLQGNYSDYADALKEIKVLKKREKQNTRVKHDSRKPDKPDHKKELKALEKRIEDLESKIKTIEQSLATPTSNPMEFVEAGKELKALKSQLDIAYSKWEGLTEYE